jgi:hypothetical protein
MTHEPIALVAQVPEVRQEGKTRWLILEADASSGGWFLFGHRSLHEPSEWDSWHGSREQAMPEAAEAWGVEGRHWRPRT